MEVHGNASCSKGMRMRVLEARFHPRTKTSGSFVVVGRVYVNGHRAWIEEPAVEDAALPMLDKLLYLVRSSEPQPFERLTQLDSEVWSFGELEAGNATEHRGGKPS